MGKRGAENQLTKDDVEAGRDEAESEDGNGTWKQADANKLQERVFVKAKRKGGATPAAEPSAAAAGGSAFPSFSFGTAAPAATSNAFTALLDPTEWVCDACFVRNKKDLTKCKACEVEKKTEAAAPAAATPAAGGFNAFTALLDPTEWVCDACFVRNKKELNKCKACEVDRKDAPASSAAPAAAAPAATGPVFNFGLPAKTDGAAAAPTFSFGATAASNTTFSFGGNAKWGFGTAPADSGAGAATSTGFTFGAKLEGAKATFGAVEGGGFTSKEGSLEGSTAQFGAAADPTKAEFKDKKRESTGEEGDTRIFSMPQTKVYTLKDVYENPDGATEEEKGKKTQKYVECGQGEMHINTCTVDGSKKARMVLRADKTQRLVMNTPLFKDMKPAAQAEKFVRFVSTDGEGKPCSYLLRFKNKTDRGQVLNKIEETMKLVE